MGTLICDKLEVRHTTFYLIKNYENLKNLNSIMKTFYSLAVLGGLCVSAIPVDIAERISMVDVDAAKVDALIADAQSVAAGGIQSSHEAIHALGVSYFAQLDEYLAQGQEAVEALVGAYSVEDRAAITEKLQNAVNGFNSFAAAQEGPVADFIASLDLDLDAALEELPSVEEALEEIRSEKDAAVVNLRNEAKNTLEAARTEVERNALELKEQYVEVLVDDADDWTNYLLDSAADAAKQLSANAEVISASVDQYSDQLKALVGSDDE